MSKKDPAISKKISKLVGEGYPMYQAVAIAMNMKRKKKLGPQGGYRKSSKKNR